MKHRDKRLHLLGNNTNITRDHKIQYSNQITTLALQESLKIALQEMLNNPKSIRVTKLLFIQVQSGVQQLKHHQAPKLLRARIITIAIISLHRREFKPFAINSMIANKNQSRTPVLKLQLLHNNTRQIFMVAMGQLQRV